MNYVETVFLQRFKKALTERQGLVISTMTAGCTSWDEYLRQLGALYGLQEAEAIADNIKEEMNKE